MSTLSDRVRGIIKAPSDVASGFSRTSSDVASGFSRTTSNLESVLDGEWRDNCFIVERHFPPASRYGRVVIGDLAKKLHASAHEAPLVCGGASARPPFLFFDLETTGLSGGAGTQAFLVGCGWFEEDGGFRTRQYLLVRYADERVMLSAVAEEFARAGALVSFNGKSFDAPVLETRYLFNRLEWTAGGQPHIDVLHPARRFWKEDECSLIALEQQLLGKSRDGDVPGFEIPARYFQFVRSGDARPLAAVLEHNRLDLVSLAAMTSRLIETVCGGPDYAENAREALALGHVYARARADDRAMAAYERAVVLGSTSQHRRASLVTAEALRALAVAYRRARRFDEAARCWTALIESGCSNSVEREAIEALAIHHEHRLRDLASAKAFAQRNVSVSASQPHRLRRAAAQQRLDRIERKIHSAPDAGRLLE